MLNNNENEQLGNKALKKYGPGGLSGRLNNETYSLKRDIFSLPFSEEPMGVQFDNFKEGGQVGMRQAIKPQGAMQFKGPGTGKSDSIDAKLPVQGFVLPVEVVQSIGADRLQAMIALFDPESAAEDRVEGQEEVAAKVSNGEVWVPPEVVQKTGPEYWDSLIASVNGQGATPEMGEHGEMMAAGGGLMDTRLAAQEFWKNAPSTPMPIPGRANPPSPADLMKDRLKTSATATAQQTPSLRAQMAQQGQSLAQPMMPTQATGSVRPQIPAFTTPDPHQNPLKQTNAMMGGEGAIATGLAYDILNSPQNVGQVNGAIAGLKQRAGFDPNSTPYPSLKNMSLKYAKGGEVKGYAGGGGIYSDEDKKKLANAGQNFTQSVGNVVGPAVDSVKGAGLDYQAARQQGYGIIPATQKVAGEQLSKVATPVIDTAASGIKQGYNFLYGTPDTAPPSLKQAAIIPSNAPVQPPQTQQQSAGTPQAPAQDALPPVIGKADDWNETGFRTDGAPQTLGWGRSHWTNSGDLAKDAALAEQESALIGLREQANVMNQNPQIAGALNPAAAILPQSLAHDTQFNNDSLAARKEIANATLVNRDYSPAFSNEDLVDLPEGAGFQDRQRLVTMPKQAWQQFNLDLANENDPKGVESRVQMFAKASGISPDVIKYKLGLTQ